MIESKRGTGNENERAEKINPSTSLFEIENGQKRG